MKISEMNNEQATAALVRISAPLGNICDDENTVKILEDFDKMEGIHHIQAFGRILPQTTSYLLQTHKEDLYEIVGALTFKKRSEVAKMNFIETLKVLKDSYDEVLRDFFTSSVNQTKEKE